MSKQINTKCNKCYFKDVEETQQVGCTMSVPETLGSLYPIYPKDVVDKSEQYWTINNFYCPFARTNDWAKIVENNLTEKVMTESSMDIGLYIYFSKDNLSEIESTAEAIGNCICKPNGVYFIANQINQSEIAEYIKKLEKLSLEYKWKVFNTIIDGNSTDCINLILQTNDKHNIFILKDNQEKYKDINKEIDNCEQLFKMTLNKKVIITKDVKFEETDKFKTLCIPVSLWHVSEKNIYACIDTIRKDLENVEDFYNIELTDA